MGEEEQREGRRDECEEKRKGWREGGRAAYLSLQRCFEGLGERCEFREGEASEGEDDGQVEALDGGGGRGGGGLLGEGRGLGRFAWKGGKEGGRERGKGKGREGGREGGKEGRGKGGREGGREGGGEQRVESEIGA